MLRKVEADVARLFANFGFEEKARCNEQARWATLDTNENTK
jgi:hypothetical protein